MTVSADHISRGIFAVASIILAWHPMAWLLRTWADPSYDSSGFAFAIAVLAVVLWSLQSGPRLAPPPRFLGLLLLAAAGFRLLSQTLAVNLLGGLALAVDIAALAYLLGLDRRPRPVSPFWLAALFLFSLPLEKVIERLLGFPLQMISARISCTLLGAIHPDTTCSGVRIGIAGQDVLVDLPCSGAAGLMLLMALFTGITAIRRPVLSVWLAWGAATLTLAILGNSLRISALAVGLVQGWEVMAEPVHSVIGLASLALSALPLLLLYRASPVRRSPPAPANPRRRPGAWRPPAALAFLVVSILIVLLPKSPIDVSKAPPPPALPATIAGKVGREISLQPIEVAYFAAFGGAAEKVQYGPLGLNRVSTTSPLRHLHRPDTCLRGLGYKVRFLGTRFSGTPTSVYEAVAPDGSAWLVNTSYVSDDGIAVSSVGEAVWHWMNGRGRRWSSVQRITPFHMDPGARRGLEIAALRALDILAPDEEP